MEMNSKDWLKIQKNWEYLKKEVSAEYLLDILRSCTTEYELITHEDEQRVRYEVVDADKVEKLLKILKSKPKNYEAYKWFLGSLKTVGQSHVAERLERTEIHPEEIKDEPVFDIKSKVRTVLLQNYVEEEGTSTPLPDVRNSVIVLKGQGVNFDWKNEMLKDFVLEVFSGVTYERQKGKKKTPTFLNLGCKEKTVLVPKVLSLPVQVEEEEIGAASAQQVATKPNRPVQQSIKPKQVESMNTTEVMSYLAPTFEKLELGDNFKEKFVSLDIDGVVLGMMKENDFKQEFTSEELTFGKRKKLMLEITKLLEEERIEPCDLGNLGAVTVTGYSLENQGSEDIEVEPKVQCKEYFRKFDQPVSPSDTYTRGRMLEVTGFSRENMINPVKKFLQIDKGEDIYRKIAKETIKFACACLNDRKNGTLYAGINPVPKDELQLGQVVGIYLDKQKCEDTVRNFIAESFFEDQHDIAFQAIRSAKFVEVLKSESSNTWVVEIDVVPLAGLVKNEAFFVRGKLLGGHKGKKKEELYRMLDGTLQSLSEKEIYDYMKKKKNLTELRCQQEFRSSDSYVQPDLRRKILNLYTGGSEEVEDEIYPVLMTSSLDSHMDEEYINENLNFIQYFDAKVVFDFDQNHESKGLYDFIEKQQERMYEVHTTENFDKTSETYSEKNMDFLKTTTEPSWVFCNGYSQLKKEKMEPFDWKQNRFDGFKEALRFFHTSIPLGRGIVIIFLFGKQYHVLLEAAAEVIPTFKNQWMVIAETEDIANHWKDEMIRRNIVNKKSVENRCVLGMPWRHVNTTFTQVMRPKQTITCQIPTSTGAFCTLKERDKMAMNDLEILSRNECEGMEELQDLQAREAVRRKVEVNFFRGGQVQWLNFWFRSNHVLRRKQHKVLIDMVEKSLEISGYDDDETVNVVTLIHQPGAGGSTTSRQILWDLRETTRCCVVRRITEETANQITLLRNYEENNGRKPPLVLVDNDEEDKFWQLIWKLEENAKTASRNGENFKVFCAVLHCIRLVNLPKSIEGDKIILKHELQPWELSWFQNKYETLERKYKEDKKVDPKLLISFNILKTNFDPAYITRTVKEFMKEIDDTKESLLLRYLALINSFDIDFQTIPISAFDPILGNQSKQKRILQFGILEKSGSRGKGWETTMSTSVRVLVNESLQRGTHGTNIRTIRITSALLAKEILSYIEQNSDIKVSEIMVEFLSTAIFDCENSSTFKLLNIIKNLVKRRLRQKDRRLDKFSPMIMDIMKREGTDKAAEICEAVYRKTEDPMIAQQIARFYIVTKNWSQAEKYARVSTQNLPKNSFLWDTYGQVYRGQLSEYYDRANRGVEISKDDASKLLRIAQNAIITFRREQVLSETETNHITNHGGYLGELRVTLLLMNTICHFEGFSDVEDLHKFLVDPNYESTFLSFLDKDEKEMLKSLGETAFRAIRKLEDESVHLKGDPRDELRPEWSLDKRTLVALKENVYTYFGEVSDEVPADLCVEDACEYRRRRVRRIGVTSLQGALALKYEENGIEKLKTVYGLTIQNVDTEWCTAFDLVTILNTVIALHVARSMIETITYADILKWSLKLYATKQTEDRPYLEKFLYLVLFHLPTESRRAGRFNLCSEVKIHEALSKWREAFWINYPKQRDTQQLAKRKDTTLFFLGKGIGLKEVIYQKELLTPGERMRTTDYWQSEKANKRFQRLEGTLLSGGADVEVQFQLSGGNKFHITIPASRPTRKRTMWQKRVYFVLGFSWSGPKAYFITLDNPSNDDEESKSSDSSTMFQVPSSLLGPRRKLADIEAEMTQVQKQLGELENKKPLSHANKKKVKSLEKQKNELVSSKAELLGDDDC